MISKQYAYVVQVVVLPIFVKFYKTIMWPHASDIYGQMFQEYHMANHYHL